MLQFWSCCRFLCSGIAGKCRRRVLLDHFQDDTTRNATSDGPCCDVCEKEQGQLDSTQEIEMVVRTVQDMPGYGEVKVSTPCIPWSVTAT